MSRALLYPMSDWPALSVACSELSCVNPREESFKRPLSNLTVRSARRGRMAVCTLQEGVVCVSSVAACPLPSKDRDVADRFKSREKTRSSN